MFTNTKVSPNTNRIIHTRHPHNTTHPSELGLTCLCRFDGQKPRFRLSCTCASNIRRTLIEGKPIVENSNVACLDISNQRAVLLADAATRNSDKLSIISFGSWFATKFDNRTCVCAHISNKNSEAIARLTEQLHSHVFTQASPCPECCSPARFANVRAVRIVHNGRVPLSRQRLQRAIDYIVRMLFFMIVADVDGT